MTAYAFDVPGYVQGHRFSSDARFYDSDNKRFYDLAGYSRFENAVDWVVGTPTFSSHGANSREGLLLDNTCQWKFTPAIPWEGTVILVFKPTLVATTVTLNTLIFGNQTTVSSNGRIFLSRSSPTNSITASTSGAALSRQVSGLTSGNITIAAFSMSQVDRKIYSTQDGVTVTGTSALAGTTNGNGIALGQMSSGTSTEGARYVRLGNNSGTLADTTQNTTNYLHLFEQHYFKGDALTSSLSKVKDFIDTLKSYYGI
jgi:hypothetical protein